MVGRLSPDAALAEAHRAEWARIVAALVRTTGDWALAEDCAQEAFLAAARRWPADGVPDRPGAWLMTTARNRAVDRLRRAATERRALAEAAREPGPYVLQARVAALHATAPSAEETDWAAVAEAYRAGLAAVTHDAERAHLARRLSEVTDPATQDPRLGGRSGR